MNLAQSISLYGQLESTETPQKDNSAMVGKPFRVVDTQSWGYGNIISEWDTEEEAKKASMARPGSKVITDPQIEQTQENRDKVTAFTQGTNSDVDGSSDKCACGKH